MGVRRAVRYDRHGRPSAVVAWRADGALASAAVRSPGGSWISIEPRAGVQAPWGAIDRLWLAPDADGRTTPLTVMSAVDWARITTIPLLAEPARLPAGAGTAVLNLLAGLAREQDVDRLAYRGPYPTEALFLSLLECFRPHAADGDLLARFMAHDLTWTPAPFVPSFEHAAYVQWRDDRVEKVVWGSRSYYREDWGPVRRLAPLRVHGAGAHVRCSLWALGAPIADHLAVGPDGVPRVVAPPAAAATSRRSLAPAVREALIALVVALSAPPLAPGLRAISAPMNFTCRPLPLDLAVMNEGEVCVAEAFAAVLARRLVDIRDRETRARLVLSALTEVAATIGDPLRLRAQAWLAAASPEAQAAALARSAHEAEAARTITAGVAAVVASGRVDDEPDVEGDEPGDRDD